MPDAVASVLGLTTVFLVYYASRHRPELVRDDLEHARSHAIGYLAVLQQEGADGN